MKTRIDPLARLTGPRLLAGALAGLLGGLAMGALMAIPAVRGDGFGDLGMMTLLSRLVGTSSLPVLWAIHLVNSMVFGALFGAFVAPSATRRTVPLGLAWGALLWLAGAFLALRLLTGAPLAMDGGLAYNLLGHLAFGAVLGATYRAFFREELFVMRERGRLPASARLSPKP